MKMPGFTAEAALHRTNGVWRFGEITDAHQSTGAVVPQFPYCFGHPVLGYICCEPWSGVCWRAPVFAL